MRRSIARTASLSGQRRRNDADLARSSAGMQDRTPAPALPLDMRHVTHYTALVIKTFADRHASELFVAGRSSRLPADIVRRARRKLEYIDLASCLEDLHVPPGNRLHKLAGDRLAGGREGQYAIAINDRWRICFRFVDGDALDVEITDYH
jgi:proteic killer suppression protein